MKKILFSILFLSALATGVQAQKSDCSKACTAKPAGVSCEGKSAATATTGVNAEAAAKLASLDASIETKTCPVTGTVSYVRKETCAHSGTVSYVDVNYDAATNTFVNVSPVKMQGTPACGAKGTSTSGKSCCAEGGKGKNASSSKSCCAGKSASASATTTSGSVAKTPTPSKN